MEVIDTLEFLLGSWSLVRSIDDHGSGVTGWVLGQATVTSAPSGLDPGPDARYLEEGELSFGTHVGPIRRRLRYHRLDGPGVLVQFEDGRPFVDLDLGAGVWQSTHVCRDDHYDITTRVQSSLVIEEQWRVRGPEKRYDAVTTLTRLN